MLLLLAACTFVTDSEVDAKFASGSATTDDADGDGYTGSVDCDDSDPTVHPSAVETWYDGVDQDCDGADDFDQDGDGHASVAYPGADTPLPKDDCYDGTADEYPGDPVGAPADPEDVYPGADDTWYDGTDQDCAGDDDYDQDGDGWDVDAECDDTDAGVFRNEDEDPWYDGVDENCDGADDYDQDGDGHASALYPDAATSLPTDDCWDDPTSTPSEFAALNGLDQPTADVVHPDADDAWYDGVDADCAGDDDFDQDGDGYASDAWLDRAGALGDDCDDLDPAISPAAVDPWYDGVDEDCAGNDDDDADGDGFDAEAAGGDDCDDTDWTISPGAVEDCGTAGDDDCDGSANDPDATACRTLYADVDGDGFGAGTPACLCDADSTHVVSAAGDCDDADAAVSPAAIETCATDVDDDCDGSPSTGAGGTDPDLCTTLYYDGDADTWGIADARCLCSASGGYSAPVDTDCDDTSPVIHPTAAETVADGIDQDCDAVDLCYVDADGDNYGTGSTGPGSSLDCATGTGAPVATDCDDAAADVNPGAVETCATDYDDDCDGTTNPLGALACTTYYSDADGDGYGDEADAACWCAATGAYTVTVAGDCDDGEAGVNPGEVDLCRDGVDQDCDGSGGTCTLSDMASTDGDVEWTGPTANQYAGAYVGAAGDFDGDGFEDGFVATLYATTNGKLWLVSGGGTPSGGSLGDLPGYTSTQPVTGAWGISDFNGDGADDVVVADDEYTGGGAVFVKLGTTATTGTLDDRVYYGSGSGRLGSSVAGGDVDGDGLVEVLIGAPGDASGAGVVYVVDSSTTSASILPTGAVGARSGGSGEERGSAAAAADFNSDGYDDFFVGSSSAAGTTGRVDLSFGGASWALDDDATLTGDTSGDHLGQTLASPGDVDGDGFPEIAVGTYVDEVALFRGSAAAYSAYLADADAIYSGVDPTLEPARVGDVDGDGFADLAFSGVGTNRVGSGAVLVLGGTIRSVDLSSDSDALNLDLDGTKTAIAGAGDLNADGFDDLLIGLPYSSSGASEGGGATLVLGTSR